jgi:hypothetical protein
MLSLTTRLLATLATHWERPIPDAVWLPPFVFWNQRFVQYESDVVDECASTTVCDLNPPPLRLRLLSER